MNNYWLVKIWQDLPKRIAKCVKRGGGHGNTVALKLLEDIDHFETKDLKKRRALVMLSPNAWLTALHQFPDIKLYNHTGFTHGLIKGLNESGYLVDMADPDHPFEFKKEYDLFVGHGGKCRPFLDQLKPGTPVYQYISGLYWRQFNEESDERYHRFFKKHGVSKVEKHRRSMEGLVDGLEYLNERADTLFTIHCPRMCEAYDKYADKFHYTGLGAYIDPLFEGSMEGRQFYVGRKNFIYVGGTSGNLQKGLDLLIEAFAQTPDLHLYIYCKVEEEILAYCREELCSKNIHYIYHWRFKPFHGKLRRLLRRTNFSVHAPINIGMGTAFMGTLGVGMIPVGYVDLEDPEGKSVLTESWDVNALSQCIRQASERTAEWCEDASLKIRSHYLEHCEPERVAERFKEMFSEAAGR